MLLFDINGTEYIEAKYTNNFQIKCDVCGIIMVRTKRQIHNAKFVKQTNKDTCGTDCRTVLQKTGIDAPCKNCGIIVYRNKMHSKKNKNIFCNSACAAIYAAKNQKINNIVKLTNCIDCNTPLSVPLQRDLSTVRCVICRKSHRDKLNRASMQRFYYNRGKSLSKKSIISSNWQDALCVICGTKFERKYYSSTKTRQTCSSTCCHLLLSQKLKGKSGGCREGAGHGKHFDYTQTNGQNFHCQSTMELEMCKVLDNLHLNWGRNNQPFKYIDINGQTRKYFPDFYIKDFDCLLETKGFFRPETKHKLLNSNIPNLFVVTYKRWGGNFEDIIQNPNILLDILKIKDMSWIDLVKGK